MKSLVYLGFHRSFGSRYFTCDARRIASRSALIPDSDPASETGRVLDLRIYVR